LVLDLLEHIRSAFSQSARDGETFGRRFGEMCLQVGETLTVELGDQRVSGVCNGIGVDGALLLQTPTGLRKFYSGVLR
jgi:biotin-(acetyl-CoA carboxylase) ligase